MTLHLHVLVDRTGKIMLAPAPIAGLLDCGAWTPRMAIRGTSVLARHAPDGTWLVPGVPEADTDNAACDAVIRFRELLKQRLGEGEAR